MELLKERPCGTYGNLADFIRATRREMRFGELSRAPLRLLSLEWRGDSAKCEWMARPADVWDADISRSIRERKVTEQALKMRSRYAICCFPFSRY